MSSLKILEVVLLNCHPLILQNNKPFLDQIVTCNESELCTTAVSGQLNGETQKKPQSSSLPNLHQKKVVVAVSWSAASMIHYSVLNLVKPFHLRMLSKSVRCPQTATPVVGTGQ